MQSLIPRVNVETDDSYGQFQSKVVWVDTKQNAHELVNDLSKPITNYDAQGVKLENKFQSLCAAAGLEGNKQLDKLVTLLNAHS